MTILDHYKKILGCYLMILVASMPCWSQDCAPVIAENQTFTIAEGLESGGVVGQLTATPCSVDRPLGGWTLTVGNELGVFEINGATGQITVLDTDLLDAEQFQLFRLKATVSDGLLTSDEVDVDINVTNVNDNPSFIIPNQQFEVVETVDVGFEIGAVQFTDEDLADETTTWDILSGNSNGIFQLGATDGVLSIQATELLDAEILATHRLEVSISDGVHTTTESVVVQVNNANDTPPVIADNQGFELDEIASNGTKLGSLEVSDADGETVYLAWTISDGNSDLDNDGTDAFSFDESGVLLVADADDLDYGRQSSFDLQVTVSDGVNQSLTAIVNVTLIDFDREDCDNDGIPNYEDLYSCDAFDVPVAFTPNGDRQNDELIIDGLENYPANYVKIVSRWGATVWEASGYDNDRTVFRGLAGTGLNVGGALPEGTYFYFIDAKDGRSVQKGFFTIKR